MLTQKYSVNQHSIETILSWVKSGEIAIPEIQRPFVWEPGKVKDLLDSLYQGFPIGYIIAWRNPNVKLKDGSLSEGKKILIDGQQRVTALRAAILDEYIISKDYERKKIRIAFNPIEERFAVLNSAIKKDKSWLPAIAKIFDGSTDQFDVVSNYLDLNPEADRELVKKSISGLFKMTLRHIGMIELASGLDIEVVTEIFIRINSKGVVLSQADFAMSKIAANEHYGGQNLRKAIDYFCHLAVAPEFYPHIVDHDKEFARTDYFKAMDWLKKENDDLYDPSYTDMLRVSLGLEFERGKLADLVSLLSGRNFETKTFEEEIAEQSFSKLQQGVMKFMNETDFKRFVMIIKSAGFIKPWMIRSQNALNFAYLVYLHLRKQGINPAKIESFVKRWFVMSILTSRYTSSPESQFDFDIKRITTRDFGEYLESVESADLGDGFWSFALPDHFDTSVSSSPFWHVYLASQVQAGDKGFLSRTIRIGELLQHRGDKHHIFPKEYLKKHGLTRGMYNQIANYVYMQSEINIKVGKRPPNDYMNTLKAQIINKDMIYGSIHSEEDLRLNLEQNCIPLSVFDMDIDDYEGFLEKRRQIMAEKVRRYYEALGFRVKSED